MKQLTLLRVLNTIDLILFITIILLAKGVCIDMTLGKESQDLIWYVCPIIYSCIAFIIICYIKHRIGYSEEYEDDIII